MSASDEAADLLIHYFRLAFEAAGKEWDGDYSAELRNLVDRLVDAAEDKADEAIRSHLENDPHIYADGSTA